MFKIIKKDKNSNARLGILSTPHGKIKTPAYVIVATHAQVKCLKPSDIKRTKTQMVIANTYHLWEKALKIKNSKLKIQGILGTKIPVMTDSGGFQVFSLGFGQKNKIGKILKPVDNRHVKSVIHRQNIRITDKGVYFRWDSHSPVLRRRLQNCTARIRADKRQKWRFLGPELSMQIQKKLGADVIFAFDECTSPLDSYEYNKKALERTHEWALKCLNTHNSSRSLASGKQMLFGIAQGGRFKSLRVKSAKFIGSRPFDGFGIGGSFGKDEMVKTLKWIIPHLPEEKPRHLLGIGRIEDIFRAVENGVDLFDCVIPTREARHGRIYTKHGFYNISKNHNKNIPLEKGCKCPACKVGITREELHALFKSNVQEKQKAQRWATIHNVWFFNNLLKNIRESIKNNKFKSFKNRFLKQFNVSG